MTTKVQLLREKETWHPPLSRINHTNILFRNDRLKEIQKILSDLAPHEHCDGVNECPICDQSFDEAILIELRKLVTPVRKGRTL